jgi:hypothetical protein
LLKFHGAKQEASSRHGTAGIEAVAVVSASISPELAAMAVF